MRKFDYREQYNEMNLIIGYIKQLEKEVKILGEIENNPIYKPSLEIINTFKEKYPNIHDVENRILDDLLSAENENNEYKIDASAIGMEFSKDLQRIIVLEEHLRTEALKSWKKDLTNFEDIKNGEEFMVVGHSTYLSPGTPDTTRYRPNGKQHLSCSLYSNNELNKFQNESALVYLVDVNDDNYISSSSFDSVTYTTKYPSFRTLKKIELDKEEEYISVGYSGDPEKAVTSISTPKLIEKLSVEREEKIIDEPYNYKNTLTNEVVLERSKTNIKGALLLGNGCDFMLTEYQYLKENDIDFKCINKGLYRRKIGLNDYTEDEYKSFLIKLNNLYTHNFDDYEITEELLEGYYKDVVLPMNYSPEIISKIDQKLSNYIDIEKVKESSKTY